MTKSASASNFLFDLLIFNFHTQTYISTLTNPNNSVLVTILEMVEYVRYSIGGAKINEKALLSS